MLVGAEAKANTRTAPVYLYNFVWKVPIDAGIWQSPHTVDIPFALGNVEKARMMTGPGPGPIKVAHNLMSAFVSFARAGDPGNSRMPEWKPYESTSRYSMTVDDPCRLISDFHGAGRVRERTVALSTGVSNPARAAVSVRGLNVSSDFQAWNGLWTPWGVRRTGAHCGSSDQRLSGVETPAGARRCYVGQG